MPPHLPTVACLLWTRRHASRRIRALHINESSRLSLMHGGAIDSIEDRGRGSKELDHTPTQSVET